jgi:hypothetical protein
VRVIRSGGIDKPLCSLLPLQRAPEWQAESLRWHSKELVAACPLEGLVGLRLRWCANYIANSLQSLVRIRINMLTMNKGLGLPRPMAIRWIGSPRSPISSVRWSTPTVPVTTWR